MFSLPPCGTRGYHLRLLPTTVVEKSWYAVGYLAWYAGNATSCLMIVKSWYAGCYRAWYAGSYQWGLFVVVRYAVCYLSWYAGCYQWGLLCGWYAVCYRTWCAGRFQTAAAGEQKPVINTCSRWTFGAVVSKGPL